MKINYCLTCKDTSECMLYGMEGKIACDICRNNIKQDKNWISMYTEEEINEAYGFVYIITNMKTNKFYIGKKQTKSIRKVKIGKREKALTKTRKIFKEVIKPMDWKNYYGSSEDLKKDIAEFGKDIFRRQILILAKDKRELTYLEVKNQFLFDVLSSDSYNKNILNRFFK